jgi:predicted nucleic acid-binding protein
VLEAAHLKVGYPIAFADAFAVATATARGASLLTGDPEILGGDPTWPVVDLRSL